MASRPSLTPTIYTGTFIHTPTLGSLEILRNAAVAVDEHGVIVSIKRDLDSSEMKNKKSLVAGVERVDEDAKWEVFGGGGSGSGSGRWWWCLDLLVSSFDSNVFERIAGFSFSCVSYVDFHTLECSVRVFLWQRCSCLRLPHRWGCE